MFFTRDAIEVKDTFVNKETPDKIKRRDKNEYFANAGIIAFSAFRRGGALGEFMQYKSFKVFSKYLKRALSARFKTDLKLLDEIGDNLKYPWDIPQKVAGIDDIRDLEYKGIRALTKAIADTSSQTDAVFWQHPKVFNEVVGLFKQFFSSLADAGRSMYLKKDGLNVEDFMDKYTYTGNKLKGFGEFQEWMKIHLEYADAIINTGSEEVEKLINSERFKE